MQSKKYQIVNTKSLLPIPCPCGTAKRAFIEDPDQVASLHVVDVQQTAKTHYHKKTTEIYYILEGHGPIELDSMRFDVGPGSAILIKPGCRHRAIGDLKLLNIPVPAFDPADEYFDDQ